MPRTESSAMLILPPGTSLRKRVTASACAYSTCDMSASAFSVHVQIQFIIRQVWTKCKFHLRDSVHACKHTKVLSPRLKPAHP